MGCHVDCSQNYITNLVPAHVVERADAPVLVLQDDEGVALPNAPRHVIARVGDLEGGAHAQGVVIEDARQLELVDGAVCEPGDVWVGIVSMKAS